jgi:hypothetical protein
MFGGRLRFVEAKNLRGFPYAVCFRMEIMPLRDDRGAA